MAPTIGRSLLLSLPLIVLMASSAFAVSAGSPRRDAGQRAVCAASTGQVGGATPASPNTVQSVESYFSSTKHRCFVIVTRRPAGIGKVLPTITRRTLYDGWTGQVLAIARHENGAWTGQVLDPDYKPAANVKSGYDEAVAYIRMSLE